ncbi:hypothetical protein KKI24_23235 [bacterium]|nr:hypothetical protein [bacterium]
MLKKIMKAALAASLVFGFSSMAMAETKVSADVQAYMGQYNSGATNYTSRLAVVSEGHVNFTGSSGPVSAFIQIETRDDASTATNAGRNLNNAQLNLTYTMDLFSVKVGTIATPNTCTHNLSSGLKTSTTMSYGSAGNCDSYLETDGIQFAYMIPAIQGAVVASIHPSALGQNTNIGLSGKASMVGFWVTMTSKLSDDWSKKNTAGVDEAVTDTASNLGVQVDLGSPKMTLSLEQTSLIDKNAKVAGASVKDNEGSSINLQFKAADIGPGQVIVTYADYEYTKGGSTAKAVKWSNTVNTDLVYRIGLGEASGVDLFYISQTTTPTSVNKTATGDKATTATYMGAGLFASF